jgi:hypothetical protein
MHTAGGQERRGFGLAIPVLSLQNAKGLGRGTR